MKKYICYGGYVTSKNDGDFHYVSANKLAILYRINPRECIMVDYSTDENWYRLFSKDFLDSLIPLYPKYDGNYLILQNGY